MILLPLRSLALLNRGLEMRGESVPARAVVPLFDETGSVQQVLLVLAGPPGLAMIEAGKGLMRVPFVGPITITLAPDSLRPLSEDQLRAIGQLWHRSLPWVTDLVATMSESAGQVLSASNCDGRWVGDVKGIFLRRDLTRISFIGVGQKGGGVQFTRWNPKYLPARTVAPSRPVISRRPSRRTRWELKPIWNDF